MKKKPVLFVFVFAVVFFAVYLQYGRSEKVYSSNTFSSKNGCEKNIVIVANRLLIIDKEAYAEELIEKILSNSIQNIYFDFEGNAPTQIIVHIYLNKRHYFRRNELYSIHYVCTSQFPLTYKIKII